MTVPGADVRGGAARAVAPRAASWLLLALTALAALVGVGVEPGARSATALLAATSDRPAVEASGRAPQPERLTQLPAPSVVGAASTSSSGSGPATDVALAGSALLLAPLLRTVRPAAASTPNARVVEGRGGRGPPLTTGT